MISSPVPPSRDTPVQECPANTLNTKFAVCECPPLRVSDFLDSRCGEVTRRCVFFPPRSENTFKVRKNVPIFPCHVYAHMHRWYVIENVFRNVQCFFQTKLEALCSLILLSRSVKILLTVHALTDSFTSFQTKSYSLDIFSII